MDFKPNDLIYKPIKTVFFDFGSTLIYFDAQWSSVLDRAVHRLWQELVRQGLTLEAEPFQATFSSRLWAYYTTREKTLKETGTFQVLESTLQSFSYSNLPFEMLRVSLAAMYKVSQNHWQVELDAHPTLASLKSLGFHLGLISNAGDNSDVQTLLDKTEIRQYFDCIVTSAAFGIRKPSPSIFEYAMKCMDTHPTNAVMIGDHLIADVLGSQNAGIFAIWINRRTQPLELPLVMSPVTPDATISSLAELPDLLKQTAG